MNAKKPGPFIADIVGIGALVVLSAAPIWFAAMPRARVAAADDRARTILNDNRTELENKMKQLEAIQQQVRQREEENARLQVGVLRHRTINELHNELPQVAAEAGVSLGGIVPGSAITDGPIVTTPIGLQGRGRYPDLIALIERIEATFPDLHLVGFSITGDPVSSETTWKLEYDRISLTDRSSGTKN
jgi:Tfp pilus assembly protein PilO